jgi:hypothetical protein
MTNRLIGQQGKWKIFKKYSPNMNESKLFIIGRSFPKHESHSANTYDPQKHICQLLNM